MGMAVFALFAAQMNISVSENYGLSVSSSIVGLFFTFTLL